MFLGLPANQHNNVLVSCFATISNIGETTMDKFTKTGADGSVDVAASANAYAKALTEWKAQNEIPTDRIEAAVEAVFDRFPGVRLSMPSLLHEAVTELKGSPAQHKALSARVQSYVTGQCGATKETRNTGRLDIQKGVGGGVLRLALPGEPIPARTKKSA
jgi:hypothetical protein